ncbi:MAG TPA: hypothetical protein VH479_12435 [Acidimicrobiales bacterium]|jgi:N-acetylneuraminic acid mutarotase
MADSGITGTWQSPYPNLPTYRTVLGLAQDQDGNLHAIGGTGADGNPTNLQEEYEPEFGNWQTASPMPTPRSSPAVAVIGTQLFAIGGYTFTTNGPRQALGTNEMLDLTTGTWTTCSPMPTPRGLAAVGVMDGKIFIVGGQGDDSLGDNQVYDPAADDWDIASPLAVNRGGLAGAVVNNALYLAGGAGDDEKVLDIMEMYDPVHDSYTELAPLPTARWLAAGAPSQDVVFVMGGSSFSTEDPLAVNEYFDPHTGAWATGDPIPVGNIGWSVAAVGGTGPTTGGVSLLAATTAGTVEDLVYQVQGVGEGGGS